MNLAGLISAMLASIRDPRTGARMVMGLSMARRTRWEALFLAGILSTIAFLVVQMIGGSAELLVTIRGTEISPALGVGLMQLVVLWAGAHLLTRLGRAFGGTGTLDGAILLIAWMQFILIFIQVLQILLMFLIPPLAPILSIFSFVLLFWLLTNFAAELHGFRSGVPVFLGVLLALILLAFFFSIGLSLLGVGLSIEV